MDYIFVILLIIVVCWLMSRTKGDIRVSEKQYSYALNVHGKHNFISGGGLKASDMNAVMEAIWVRHRSTYPTYVIARLCEGSAKNNLLDTPIHVKKGVHRLTNRRGKVILTLKHKETTKPKTLSTAVRSVVKTPEPISLFEVTPLKRNDD